MKLLLTLLFCVICAAGTNAQSGVLIPGSAEKPDEKILSLQTMNVRICADNQTVRVKITQIFRNHTAQIQEGKFLFALPEGASIADFAVWDGVTRIPGVMLERRRANEIYETIKQQTIDPGILQIDDERAGKTTFSAKVFPIPAYGTKRLEMEYTQNLALENFTSHLTFPFKPSFGEAQTIGSFELSVCLFHEFPITAVNFDAENFPLRIATQNAHEFSASFAAENFVLRQDFFLDYKIAAPNSFLSLIAYRAPETISAYELRNPALADRAADGYFELRAVFNENKAAQTKPRRLVLLIDTSLSMYGEKLQRAVEAADFLLRNLRPEDEFNLVLFGNAPNVFSERPVAAAPDAIERALEFIKNANLGGGTNLKRALAASIELAENLPAGEKSLVLISDLNSTRETADVKKILSLFDDASDSLKLYALALGSDADTTALGELTRKTGGFYLHARETENISPLLPILLAKIGSQTIENIRFSSDAAENFYGVYASGTRSYDGSSFSYVGRYKKPSTTNFNLQAQFGAGAINLRQTIELPAFADFHAHLPRLWAQARIDALVREIDLYGEREDFISEIIALSQKYKIVSPYTAFIAAPRALLRPRLIQPGDPVIRVKTDESVISVFAVLPFGETLALEFLDDEKIWQTRFLAPAWMADGTYTCRLLLTDRNGNGYEETKTFVVDSSAPRLKIELSKTAVRAGEEIEIRASSDKDTSKLTAKLYGARSVDLFWSKQAKASVGKLAVPENLAAGRYVLTVVAEDFARNQTSEEIFIEILN